MYLSLVTSYLGVVSDETDRLRSCFVEAAVHPPPAVGFPGLQRLTRGPVVRGIAGARRRLPGRGLRVSAAGYPALVSFHADAVPAE